MVDHISYWNFVSLKVPSTSNLVQCLEHRTFNRYVELINEIMYELFWQFILSKTVQNFILVPLVFFKEMYYAFSNSVNKLCLFFQIVLNKQFCSRVDEKSFY